MENFCIVTVFHNRQEAYLGNTAAVIEMESAWTEEEMANMAAELQQPATTYLLRTKEGHYQVYWFAPDGEIDLCGHGSLAAASYLHQFKGEEKAILHYRNGHVKVGYEDAAYFLWIEPIEIIDHLPVPAALEEALGQKVHDYFSTANKFIVLLSSEEDLRSMQPDFKALAKLEPFGYTVTAPGNEVDFVSRTLVPKVQQLEDHATGSSHAALCPFWSERLMKNSMSAIQLSPRGGVFQCEMHLNQVLLKGRAQIWTRGRIEEKA